MGMLRASAEEKKVESGIRPYSDAHFQDPARAMQLALRMLKAGMLRATAEKKGTLSMFTVLKGLDARTEGGKSKVDVRLRLIFDQRRENAGWKDPPWVGLGGAAAIAQLDLSTQINEQGLKAGYVCGDIPDYFYRMKFPPCFAAHFVLEGSMRTRCGRRRRSSLPYSRATVATLGCRSR